MEPEIRKYTVTTPIEVLRCPISKLHNFNINGVSSFEVGNKDLEVGSGEPVSAGGNWGYTHRDFKPGTTGEIVVYAGASSSCVLTVTTWRN